MTVIGKNYYHVSGHVVTSMCIWHFLASTYPQMSENTCKDGEEYFWWDQSWQRAAISEDSKSDVWEYLVSLPVQNLYLNFSFTITIVFTVVQESVKYCYSWKFHYHPALHYISICQVVQCLDHYGLHDISIYTCIYTIDCSEVVQGLDNQYINNHYRYSTFGDNRYRDQISICTYVHVHSVQGICFI